MTIHDLIFELWPHLLPMSKIKSRSNAFSIFRQLFSYLYSCSVLTDFLPLCLGMSCISFFRSRFSRVWIGLLPYKPNPSATSGWFMLLSNMCLISGSSPCIFLLDVVLFSYIKGDFSITENFFSILTTECIYRH